MNDQPIEVDTPEAPVAPIWSLRGFSAHVLTVTIGFLIALGLNSLLSLYEQHRTAAQARGYFQLEIAENRTLLANDLQANDDARKSFAALIAYLQQRKAGAHPAPPQHIRLETTSVALSHAAWDTGLASQALTYLSFDQTAALARLYATQDEFAQVERDALRASYDMSSFGDADTFSDNQIPQTLNTLRRSYAYILSIAQLERKLLKQCDDTTRALSR